MLFIRHTNILRFIIGKLYNNAVSALKRWHSLKMAKDTGWNM